MILKKVSYQDMLLLNSRGSVSMVILPFFMILCCMAMLNLSKSIEEYQVLKFRAKSYLCMKRVINLNRNYMRFFNKTNIGILSSYYLKKIPIPKTRAAAKATHKTLKAAQSLYHMRYLSKLKSKTGCSLSQLISVLKTGPAKTRAFMLRRNSKGQARMRKKWKNTFLFLPRGPLAMKRHSFKNTIKFKNKKKGWLSKTIRMSSKELSL